MIIFHLDIFFLTQLYKRLCPSVGPSVGPSVRHGDRVENERFRCFMCKFECWRWVGVWMGVGCPCPPVRNDIVTPCHLFIVSRPEVHHRKFWDSEVTSEAGSQYRCGRVGRGILPLSLPQPTSNTQTYTKSIENACFQFDHHDGRTDRRTDGQTDGQSLL